MVPSDGETNALILDELRAIRRLLEARLGPEPAPTPVVPGLVRLADLGWTKEEAARVRGSLLSFEEGWSAPGMEDYDRL